MRFVPKSDRRPVVRCAVALKENCPFVDSWLTVDAEKSNKHISEDLVKIR